MAAVLARACCVEPCNAIGKGCTACCDGCGKCCHSVCGPLGRCMDSCCNACGEACFQPFSFCAFITVLLALVGLVMGVVSLIPEDPVVACTTDIALPFLAISLALCVAHISFVIYLFRAINKPKDGQADDGTGALVFGNNGVFRHAWHFFLNDVPMAIYILVFIFSFVWSLLGETWMRQCPDGSNERQFGVVLADILLAYAIVAACLFFATLFALCCCGDYYSERVKQRQNYVQAKGRPGNLAPTYYDVDQNYNAPHQQQQQQAPMVVVQQPSAPPEAIVYHQPVVQPQVQQQPQPTAVQGSVGTPQRINNGNQQQQPRSTTDQALAVASTAGHVAVAAGRGAFSAARSAWRGRKK